MICFVLFRNGHFHNVVWTFTNVVKLDVENDNVVSTLSNVVRIILVHIILIILVAKSIFFKYSENCLTSLISVFNNKHVYHQKPNTKG